MGVAIDIITRLFLEGGKAKIASEGISTITARFAGVKRIRTAVVEAALKAAGIQNRVLRRSYALAAAHTRLFPLRAVPRFDAQRGYGLR
jgi:hypothetical protein